MDKSAEQLADNISEVMTIMLQVPFSLDWVNESNENDDQRRKYDMNREIDSKKNLK